MREVHARGVFFSGIRTRNGLSSIPIFLPEFESELAFHRRRIDLSSTPEPAVCRAQMDSAPKTELLAKTVTCGGMHTAALTEEVQ